MRKIVLCDAKEASAAFYFSDLDIGISSYEELCEMISKCMIYFLLQDISPQLRMWMKEEFDLQLKEEDPGLKLKEIACWRSFFSVEERQELIHRMRRTYLLSEVKKQKLLGDLYVNLGKYQKAYGIYQKIENQTSSFSDKEQKVYYYHMGLCLARMFRLQEAKEYFQGAVMLGSDEKCRTAFITVCYLTENKEEFLKENEVLGFDPQAMKQIYGNMEERSREVREKDTFVKLEKIDYHRREGNDRIGQYLTQSLLEGWKNEFRRENI